MGQGASTPRSGRGSAERSDRSSPRPRTAAGRPLSTAFLGLPNRSTGSTQARRHSTFLDDLSPPTASTAAPTERPSLQASIRRRARLLRAYTSLGTSSQGGIFSRHGTSASGRQDEEHVSDSQTTDHQSRPPLLSASSAPQLEIPTFAESLEESLMLPSLRPIPSAPTESFSWRRSSNNSDTAIDRRASISADRSFRGMTASLRRRRSPLPREDTSALLTRILTAAAAATAMSLTGGSPEASINDLHSPASTGIDGDDGSFNGFLQSLRNGRLAGLGQGQPANGSAEGQDPPAALEFFRMFRFGTSHTTRRRNGPTSSRPSSSRSSTGPESSATAEASSEGQEGDRMIPVLIVGIRALNDNDVNEDRTDSMPSFLDSLASAPTAVSVGSASDEPTTAGTETPVTEGRRSRRTTIGGFNFFSHDRANARHEERSRPTTSHASPSETPPGPHPPPTTPASPGLSALSSGTTTPTRRSSISSSADLAGTHSRRDSLYRRLTGTALEPTLEEQQSSEEQTQPRPRGLRRRPRISSWADVPRHDPRRNGVLMEPSDSTPVDGSNTRSWIIYILGGNYPENHPILTTPSLFTDSPTYEDMLMLSNLLGSAKPPVANSEDVVSAGGLFKVDVAGDVTTTMQEVAGEERIEVPSSERCLVCLSEYLAEEEVRRLAKCKHVFHRECIDQWLTTGRNSCPLCRSQGVEEKASGSSEEGPSSTASPVSI